MSTGRSFLLAFYIAVVYCFLCCACASASKSDKSTVHHCGKPVKQPRTGHMKIDDRPVYRIIAGGEEALEHTWPWMVHITTLLKEPITVPCPGRIGCTMSVDSSFCGASLIDRKWLLTAAHCLTSDKRKIDIQVEASFARLGMHNFDEANALKINFKNVTIHPNYSPYLIELNDFALIELQEEVQYGDNVSPICLTDNNNLTAIGTESYVTGWGVVGPKDPATSKLKQAMVPIRKCIPTRDVHKSKVCAGHGGDIDACRGDSGSPLMTRISSPGNPKTDTWYQTGVVSYGDPRPCGLAKNAGVYGRVSHVCNWIADITGKNLCLDGKSKPAEPEKPEISPEIIRPIMPDSGICDVLKLDKKDSTNKEEKDDSPQTKSGNVQFSCGIAEHMMISGDVRIGENLVKKNNLHFTETLDFQCNCKPGRQQVGMEVCKFEATKPMFNYYLFAKQIYDFVGFKKFGEGNGVLETIEEIKCVLV